MNKVLINKFKILFISITALLFTHQLIAQSPNFEWAQNMGSTQSDKGNAIAIDSSGNVYTTGTFQGTVDFNPGAAIYNLTAMAMSDMFISKFDSLGNFIWAKSIGGAFHDEAKSIAIDGIGNVYTTGYYSDTVDFDPGPGTFNLISAGNGIFISKLDSSGNFLWAKSIGNINPNQWIGSTSIAVDSFNNIYTTGWFLDTVDFDPSLGTFNLTTGNGENSFILKLDSTGNFVWAKNIESIQLGSSVVANSINVDASGNIYATGNFVHIVDCDPGPGVFNLVSPNYAGNIFILKLNASGNFVWARSMWGKVGAQGGGFFSIKADGLGNVYTSGSFRDTVDFDPGGGTYNLTSLGSDDIFISKLDSLGNFVWAKSIGGVSKDMAYSLALDASGNAYTTGSFIGTADFDPGLGVVNLISSGLEDIFISKLDASGNFVWAKKMGGSLGEEAFDIAVDKTTNGIYTTGYFNGTVDFNEDAGVVNLTSFGLNDIFVHKMSQSGVGITENSNSNNAGIYPNPTAGLFTIELDNASVITINNTLGQLILNEKLDAGKQNINLESEAYGIYFVRVTSNNIVRTHKILKR